MLDKSANAGQHSYEARGADCYQTPSCAVEALLRVENVPHHVWEPACGPGAIVRVLRDHGHQVIASDLIDYGDPTHFYGRDFLMEKLPKGVEIICTNPPYQLADAFVRHAIKICPLVIMLLRLAFLESVKRSDILDNAGLARIHVAKERLPMMHRALWAGPRASSAIPFAWFCWSRGHQGPTTIDRFSWRNLPTSKDNGLASS